MRTGVDKILQQMGGSPEKNKTGVDKILEILENGGGGGGGGLPPYTSADKGKFLGLGEGSSTTEVIVPEQTGECVDISGYVGFDVVNADLDYFADIAVGDTCSLKINGVDKTMEATDQYLMGSIAFVSADLSYALVPFYVDDTITSVVFGSSSASVGDEVTISATASVPVVEPKWENGGVTVTLPSDFISLFQTAMQSAITDILTNSRTGIVYAETSNFAGTGLADFVTEVKNAAAAALEMKTIWVKGVTDEPIAAQYAQVLNTGNIGIGFIVPSYEVGNPINRIFTIFIHVSGTVNGDGDVTSVKARAGFQVWTSAS